MDKYVPTGGPNGAAFFDFDHTLLDGDAGVVFGRTMVRWLFEQGDSLSTFARPLFYAKVGRITGGLVAKEAAYRALYAARLLKRSQVLARAYQAMEGLPVGALDAHLERVWRDVLSKRLYPEMLDVMQQHRDLGHKVVIVSTGLKEIVEYAKRYVGDDVDVIAVYAEREGGRWTGEFKGPLYGGHKAERIKEYAEHHGIDLAASSAYSDHYSDLAFLAAVGHPVCVNPEGRLRRAASRRGWDVLNLPSPAP